MTVSRKKAKPKRKRRPWPSSEEFSDLPPDELRALLEAGNAHYQAVSKLPPLTPTEEEIGRAMEALEARADRAEDGVRYLLGILTRYITTEPKRTARAVARRLKSERDTVTKLQAMNQTETAAFLGVATKTVHRWTRTKALPFVRFGPKTVRFDRADVTRWRNEQGKRPGRSRFGSKPHAPTPLKKKRG